MVTLKPAFASRAAVETPPTPAPRDSLAPVIDKRVSNHTYHNNRLLLFTHFGY
jgi:hypothetical protein